MHARVHQEVPVCHRYEADEAVLLRDLDLLLT